MSRLNSNLNFTGVELIKFTSKNHKGGDEGGRNDRACNSRPSRGNGQWFAYPEVCPDYGQSVFLSDVARTIPIWLGQRAEALEVTGESPAAKPIVRRLPVGVLVEAGFP